MKEDDYMERGKSQVLYEFLPGNTFDYSNPVCINKVNKIHGLSPSSDVSTEFVGRKVLRRKRQWESTEESKGTSGFPNQPSNFQLVTPSQVESEIFPRLFYCKKCDRVKLYDSSSDIVKYNPQLKCVHDDCGGELKQHQYVAVHACGNISSLRPPRQCNSCGNYDNWTLDPQGSQKFRNFRWRCKCGNTKDTITQYCRDGCGIENKMMTPAVHRGSNVFQPHYFSFINISGDGSSQISDKETSADYLKQYYNSNTKESRGNNSEGKKEKIKRRLKTFREEKRDTDDDAEKKLWREKIEEAENQLQNLKPEDDRIYRTYPFLDDQEFPQEEKVDALENVLESVQLENTLEPKNLEGIKEEVIREDQSINKNEDLREVRQTHQKRGIADIEFIDSFPISTVIFGYTRDGREETESRLNGFNKKDARVMGDKGTPLFYDTVETEALRIRLSPSRCMKWLLENSKKDNFESKELRKEILGSTLPNDKQIPVPKSWTNKDIEEWLEDSELNKNDIGKLVEWNEKEIRAWFINNSGQIPSYDTVKIEEDSGTAITYYLYHMIHSYSHVFLKKATTISGFERTSLSEYLMPWSLSFVIYSNNKEQFNVGGIYTLMESGLKDLFSEINQDSKNCVYDPVCSRRSSSCFSCMHLSEVSCTHLNRNLGRHFLFGSKNSTPIEVKGYWHIKNED